MKGITLIGMPASGKSTVGRLLAESLSWPIYDIDLIMETKEAMPLAQIIKQKGQEYVKKLEAQCVLDLNLEDAVLAPGGSIIYGKECHDYIKKLTNVIWIDVPIKHIQKRLADDQDNERGILGMEDGGLEGLFVERRPKYRALADIIIDAEGKSAEIIAKEILTKTA